MTQQYTELHLHTGFSLLDGLNSPVEYMKRANELGMTHLSITDHGGLSGHREFQTAAKEAGITPVLGVEAYISETDRFDRRAVKKRDDNTQAYNHLVILAQDEGGLNNLNRLSELAWSEGFYSKPRIDMEILEEFNEGLIVTSGCLNGLIPKAIDGDRPAQADMLTREFKRIFGERFFMEIQSHNPDKINVGLIELARKHGVEPVVTSDCHYARKEDLWLEEAMLILSTKPKSNPNFDYSKSQKMEMLERFNYAYPDRKMSFQDFELYLHSAETHQQAFKKTALDSAVVQRGIDNTMVVASMIGDYPYHEALDLLPKPKEGDADEILRDKVFAGLDRLGLSEKTEYVDRANEELEIIKNKSFSPYFLIEEKAIAFGKTKDILFGPGRGSGAGSLVNYALDITQVDPIEHKLLFMRFINPDRNDFPDIDTDVEDRRRSEIKEFLLEEYENVASIATFGTFQGKNSVRDAARVFLVPLGDVNVALKGADWPSGMDWFEQWEATDKGKAFRVKYPEVVKLAKFLHGRIRTQGMHAGGIVVSSEPIAKYAPMQTAKDNSDPSGARIPLVAYDMNTAADIGFIKYDFLGLKALSIIQETLTLIKERHGKDIDLRALEMTDKRVYRSLSEGFTRGVFQCEATPYTNLLIKMGGVRTFEDLVASNALVRPGAMNSTAGAAYIARNKGEEMVTYHHPKMQDFTSDTHGVVIYQEQVMLTMTELAGMSMSDADKVRKIIGKKGDSSMFDEYKAQFVDGASQHVTKKAAEQLWSDFEAHAGYSFNKSHAVAYSMLSYRTAWLKQYYPIEFMTAVLRNEGDKDSLLDYLMETKRLGLRVKLPHVNESGIEFEIQPDERGDYIRMGLSNIKYISGKVGAKLLENRPFNSYNELYDRVMTKGSGLSTRTLQALNAIGGAAFDDNPLKGNERDHFFEYLNIPAFQVPDLPPKVRSQFRPLDEFSPEESFVSMGMVRGIKTGPGWSRIEIVDESGSAGVFAAEHTQIEAGQMYVFLISNNRIGRYISMEDISRDKGDDEFVKFLHEDSLSDVTDGLHKVVAFNSRVTKAGKKMADAVLSDGDKNLTSILVFPMQFMKAFSMMRVGAVVDLEIKQTKEGTPFLDDIKGRYA